MRNLTSLKPRVHRQLEHLGLLRRHQAFLLDCNLGVRREVSNAVSFQDRTLAEDVLLSERTGVSWLWYQAKFCEDCLPSRLLWTGRISCLRTHKTGRATAGFLTSQSRGFRPSVLRRLVLATPLVLPLLDLWAAIISKMQYVVMASCPRAMQKTNDLKLKLLLCAIASYQLVEAI